MFCLEEISLKVKFETITRCKCSLVYSVASSATYNAQHATEEIDMDNLDQGFFASGLDSFDMGVIQNRFGFVSIGWMDGWMEGLGRGGR